MLRTRVIPCLLLMDGRLVKTIRFRDPTYVGDPINIVRIFNTKEVDEIIFLDISAGPSKKGPDFELLKDISSECFMPVAYGGGISCLHQVKRLFNLGIEKVAINSHAYHDLHLINHIATTFGIQSVIASIDVKKKLLGKYVVCIEAGRKTTEWDPVEYAKRLQEAGAGEILLTSINNDGMMAGYDIALLKRVTHAVQIPVIACGGAGSVNDFGLAVADGGASAVAAGSMVVFQGKNRAVLTKFPSRTELMKVLP